MNHFGEHIRELREQRKLLQRQLAALLETDTAFISKFEKGEKRITREQVLKLAGLFKVPEKSLLPLWLSDKVKDTLQDDPYSSEALKITEQRIKFKR